MKVRDLVPWGRSKSDGARSIRAPERLQDRTDSQSQAIQSLRGDINSVFDRFFDRFETAFLPRDFQGAGAFTQPSLDISEGKNKVSVSVDLPGLEDKEIEVSFTGDVLTIRGERNEEHRTEEDGRIVQERNYGSFYRTVQLPSGVKPEAAKARFKNGVLTVTVPKTGGAKSITKRIDVRAA
ncbi:MAG: Hsp20/alpha crystallin family protein [Hellea sp.]|nr:Hsp20/alpha crystallin family protein [Hellea sp.]